MTSFRPALSDSSGLVRVPGSGESFRDGSASSANEKQIPRRFASQGDGEQAKSIQRLVSGLAAALAKPTAQGVIRAEVSASRIFLSLTITGSPDVNARP